VRRRLTGEKRGGFVLPGSNFFARPVEASEAAWKADVEIATAGRAVEGCEDVAPDPGDCGARFVSRGSDTVVAKVVWDSVTHRSLPVTAM